MDDKYLANQWVKGIQELSNAIENLKNLQELIDEVGLYDRLQAENRQLYSLNETKISEKEYTRCINIVNRFRMV
jgi:hypothetical protein